MNSNLSSTEWVDEGSEPEIKDMNVEIQTEPIDEEAKAVRGHRIFSSDFLCSSELVGRVVG